MTTKNRLFLRLARAYVRHKLAASFADVRLGGLQELRAETERGPLVFACNHVAWWDPLLLVHLETAIGCDGYCLMDAQSLKQLPFFKWVGALPIDRSSSLSAYRDLCAAERVLRGPGKVLAVFPHGKQRPAHLPLQFQPGVATLAAVSNAPVVPLAIRYDYQESPRPVVHMSAGTPLVFGRDADTRLEFTTRLEEAVSGQFAAIDAQVLEPSTDFVSLLGREVGRGDHERIPRAAAVLKLVSPGETP